MLSLSSLALFSAEEEPVCRYKVIPDESGQFITVRAEVRPQNTFPYLKDFELLESIRWFIRDKEISVESERVKDILVFSQLPTSEEATAIYKLNCITPPVTGPNKKLIGSPNFILAREGLFLGMNGLENRLVEVSWELPTGWQLALGNQGLQPFFETQRQLWVAGKTRLMTEEKFDGKVFKIAALDQIFDINLLPHIDIMKSIFKHAWQNYGPLEGHSFGLAIFPRKSLGGGTRLYDSTATEENWISAVYDMLRSWSNFLSPAWFREGVHLYISVKICSQFGLINQDQLKMFLDMRLQEHLRVVEREGKPSTLAESSENFDRQSGGGDMTALMPIFAYKLDREIQAHSPGANLDQVYAAVCRKRHQKLDIMALIKEITSYDPNPLFQKYFYSKVKNVDDLLK